MNLKKAKNLIRYAQRYTHQRIHQQHGAVLMLLERDNMKDMTIDELQALRIELTEDLRQTEMDLVQCNHVIAGSKDRAVLERQRLIRLDLIEAKKYTIDQMSEVKNHIKLHNVEHNKPNNYGDLMRENNERLDKIILLLRKINKKMGSSKCSVE